MNKLLSKYIENSIPDYIFVEYKLNAIHSNIFLHCTLKLDIYINLTRHFIFSSNETKLLIPIANNKALKIHITNI